MLERRSAISSVLSLASHKHPGIGAQVCLSERGPLTIFQISAFASTIGQAQARLVELLECTAPAPIHFSHHQHLNLKHVGPGVWLLVATAEAVPQVDTLRTSLAALATVVDLSHARTALLVSGPSAARTLAKFCGLNLAPGVFETGRSTNTRFGHIGMTLSRLNDEPAFELLVFRGYAQHVCESLIQTAAEFGLTIKTEQ